MKTRAIDKKRFDMYIKAGMIITVSLIAILLIPFSSEEPKISGAAGQVKLTVCGDPPKLGDLGSYTLSSGEQFLLEINSTNPNNRTLNFSVSPDSFNTTDIGLYKKNSTVAVMNVTPESSDKGIYNLSFEVTDGWCTTEKSAVFSVTFNNSAPVLKKPIPNQTWDQDKTITPFLLDDYYYDPDGDSINYSSEDPDNIGIKIDSSSAVTFKPDSGWYGVRYTKFTACDKYGACTDSNVVKLKVEKVEVEEEPAPSGGGGDSPECEEDWNCTQWGPCIDGMQERNCTDLNECPNPENKPSETRACVPGETTTTTSTTTTSTTTTTTIKEEKMEVEREPWLVMFLLIFLALIVEIHTYLARKKKHVSSIAESFLPFVISISLIFGSVFYYIYHVCMVLKSCGEIPLIPIVVSLVVFFISLVLVRMKWKYILKKIRKWKKKKERQKKLERVRFRLIGLLNRKFDIDPFVTEEWEKVLESETNKKTVVNVKRLLKKSEKKKATKQLIKDMEGIIKDIEDETNEE